MNTVQSKKRVAIMIDGENVPASTMSKIEAIATSLGDVQLRRVYGNFANGANGEWIDHSKDHPLDVRQVTPSKNKKNTTDIALAVETVEIVLRKGFDCVCIASNDRDFQPLVEFLRKEGAEVHGFGGDAADLKLRNSCSKYHIVLNTRKAAATSSEKVEKPTAAATKAKPPQEPSKSEAAKWAKVREALNELAKQREWVALPELATVLSKAKLQPASFGSRSWLQVFKKDSRFAVEKIAGSTQSQVRLVA